VNKTGLVDEVRDRLGVSATRAKALVDAVIAEMRSAVAEGQSLTLRGLGFTPDQQLRDTWAAATDSPDQVAVPMEPAVVPYDPPRDPEADAIAAVAAEQGRPVQPEEPVDVRLVATMPEPELPAEPATLAYSSGEADTDESIADLVAGRD
jgi:Bacterial DNA-binding protein